MRLSLGTGGREHHEQGYDGDCDTSVPGGVTLPRSSGGLTMTSSSFGTELKRLREAAGLTQEELAERAGLTSGAVSALERGHRRRPYPHTFRALVAALRLTPEQHEGLVAFTRQQGTVMPTIGMPATETPTGPVRPPVPLSNFVGREQELLDLRGLLATTRLLTLVGVGGVGKTRLVLELARDTTDGFPDGVWIAELANANSQPTLWQTIAAAAQIHEQPGQSLVQAVTSHFESRCSMIILDNCEHLITDCAHTAAYLLSVAPRLTILATSRETLRIAGEVVWAVPPLESPPPNARISRQEACEFASVRLLVERAHAASPRFTLTDDNVQAVANLCSRLDGLPLAIELAAGRVSTLGIQEIARRLDRLLPVLTAGARTAPRRQQTLRATFDWSYELLDEPEKLLFDRLSVFSGGWTLEAAEAIVSGGSVTDANVIDLLSGLVDKSLVSADLKETGAVRYRLLESIREYAQQHLVAREEATLIRRRHAEYFLLLAEAADREMRGPFARASLDRVELELANFSAALHFLFGENLDESGLRLAAALWGSLMMRRHWTEGSGWLERFLGRVERVPPTSTRAHGLHGAAVFAVHRGDFATARRYAEDGAGIARLLGYAGPIGALGWLCVFLGDYESAETLLLEDVQVSRRNGDRFSEALALRSLADVYAIKKNSAGARRLLDESLRAFESVGSTWGLGMAFNGLGDLARSDGDYSSAREFYERSLRCFRGLQSDTERSVLQNLGYVAHRQGDERGAAEFLLESLSQFIREGDRRGTAECLVGLGGVANGVGHPTHAARLFGAVETLLKTIHAELTPLCRAEYERDLAAARAALDLATFERAFADGEELSPEQAITEARDFLSAEEAPLRASAKSLLSPREQEVLTLLGRGLNNKQIADELVIGVRTAETHVEHILRKLQLDNRAQAMIWVREHPGESTIEPPHLHVQ
jgi:predicted ATPase/DNA-binding CsgD family transcriptional regulator/DNA-binding XRE family transcriptional regulator